MANVWIVLDLMNASAKMDGLVKIAKKKLKCVRQQHAKMMPTALIYSKTFSVFAPRERTENNARYLKAWFQLNLVRFLYQIEFYLKKKKTVNRFEKTKDFNLNFSFLPLFFVRLHLNVALAIHVCIQIMSTWQSQSSNFLIISYKYLGMHGGSCRDFGSGLNCTCPEDYTGIGCQYEFDACEAGQCKNGASCIDKGQGYTCICQPG